MDLKKAAIEILAAADGAARADKRDPLHYLPRRSVKMFAPKQNINLTDEEVDRVHLLIKDIITKRKRRA